ncbi:MAG TPA: hypothetical protein VJU61_18955, partial [Polyangiaceae bacterium]|nr:hypothetical protein [Polyangiaceae bacterium]
MGSDLPSRFRTSAIDGPASGVTRHAAQAVAHAVERSGRGWTFSGTATGVPLSLAICAITIACEKGGETVSVDGS